MQALISAKTKSLQSGEQLKIEILNEHLKKKHFHSPQ
jgi:hypothetical protein